MSGRSPEVWDAVYEAGAPWDLEEPQPAIVDVAESGAISGRVLDAGCGTGTHALSLAARGHEVVGVDVSSVAIERARERERSVAPGRAAARKRGAAVEFHVADVLELDPGLGPFETVLDVGTYHAFEPAMRTAYADRLAAVTEPGATVVVLAFDLAADDLERTPASYDGPTPNVVERGEFAEVFADGWTVRAVREATFESRHASVPSRLAVVDRVE